MSTATIPLTIIQKTPKKISVEIDRHGFERLADSLGFFSNEFIASIGRAELDLPLHESDIMSLPPVR